jgi:hypothetical protein
MKAIIRKAYLGRSGKRVRKRRESDSVVGKIIAKTRDFDLFQNVQKACRLRGSLF